MLLNMQALNIGSSQLYVMLFDAVSQPAPGAVPFQMPTAVNAKQSAFVFENDQLGDILTAYPLKNGLWWAASTTAASLTVDTTSSIWLSARTVLNRTTL
jgi:hypothetical protein